MRPEVETSRPARLRAIQSVSLVTEVGTMQIEPNAERLAELARTGAEEPIVLDAASLRASSIDADRSGSRARMRTAPVSPAGLATTLSMAWMP